MRAPIYYAFLVRRPIDREPWPTIFGSKERAEAYEHRASAVVQVQLDELSSLTRCRCGGVVLTSERPYFAADGKLHYRERSCVDFGPEP